MTKLESISYYERLHDLFERVSPAEMPGKIGDLIEYLEKAGEYHSVSVSDVTSILYDMQSGFELALVPAERGMLLTDQKKGYMLNIYPIMNFLNDNELIDGELDQLKSRLISLAHAKNVAELKEIYLFIDLLSITFAG